eukprot:Gb_37677 [translate_table: standard]
MDAAEVRMGWSRERPPRLASEPPPKRMRSTAQNLPCPQYDQNPSMEPQERRLTDESTTGFSNAGIAQVHNYGHMEPAPFNENIKDSVAHIPVTGAGLQTWPSNQDLKTSEEISIGQLFYQTALEVTNNTSPNYGYNFGANDWQNSGQTLWQSANGNRMDGEAAHQDPCVLDFLMNDIFSERKEGPDYASYSTDQEGNSNDYAGGSGNRDLGNFPII